MHGMETWAQSDEYEEERESEGRRQGQSIQELMMGEVEKPWQTQGQASACPSLLLRT